MIKQGDTYIPQFNDRLIVKTLANVTAQRDGQPATPRIGQSFYFQIAKNDIYHVADAAEGVGWQISAAAFEPLGQQPYVTVEEADDEED